MSVEQNKETVRRFTEEVFNKGNFGLITQFLDSKYVNHDPSMPEEIKGTDGFRDFVSSLRSAFPDLSMKVEDVFCEGDKCCARWSATGTHRGEFMGVSSTGKRITVTGSDIYRFSGSKIVENWSHWDALGFFQQLGVVPELENVS